VFRIAVFSEEHLLRVQCRSGMIDSCVGSKECLWLGDHLNALIIRRLNTAGTLA